MASPLFNGFVVQQALARLTGQFQQPTIRALLAAYMQPLQALEASFFEILEARVLSTAVLYNPPETNSVLDDIGALVGVKRSGAGGPNPQSDFDYQTLIYLQIAVNKSTGRITDFSDFGKILTPFCETIQYVLGDNADFMFCLFDVTLSAILIARQLSLAVPNGVYGLLAFSTWAEGNDFEFTWSGDTTVGEAGWGWSSDTSQGGVMVAGFAL
jgi:hypothetical protein